MLCYRGEANSIQLCDKHSANSRTLSIDYWYFKENSLSILLRRVSLMPQWMPNSVQMWRMFCLTSTPHESFVFAFKCKHGLKISMCCLKAKNRTYLKFSIKLGEGLQKYCLLQKSLMCCKCLSRVVRATHTAQRLPTLVINRAEYLWHFYFLV